MTKLIHLKFWAGTFSTYLKYETGQSRIVNVDIITIIMAIYRLHFHASIHPVIIKKGAEIFLKLRGSV